jgi:hypothetical protein
MCRSCRRRRLCEVNHPLPVCATSLCVSPPPTHTHAHTHSVDPVDEEVAAGFVRWIRQVLRSREEYDSSTAGGRDEDDPTGARRAGLVEPKSLIVAAVSALRVRVAGCPAAPPHFPAPLHAGVHAQHCGMPVLHLC